MWSGTYQEEREIRMIIGGKKYNSEFPVMSSGERVPLTVALTGTTWAMVKEFDSFAQLYEILAKVPALTDGSNVILGIFDPDHLVDGDERWNSGNISAGATSNIGLDRVIVPGNLLRIKADGTSTQDVELVLYLAGV